jgi:hypothetical protein
MADSPGAQDAVVHVVSFSLEDVGLAYCMVLYCMRRELQDEAG